MDLGLSGRGALVIGATGGIGSAVAELLADEGVGRLALGVRSHEVGRQLAERFAERVRVEVVECDLADPAAPARCVERADAAVGPIDIVVVAAGNPARGGLWDVHDEALIDSVQSKLFGSVRLLRAAVPPMVKRGWGRVVLVGGLNGRRPSSGGIAGGIANAGLANLATAVAKDVAPAGVTVNVVDPHFTRTPRWDAHVASVQQDHGVSASEAERRLLDPMPTQHPVPPGEIAALIGLLVSDRCSSVTGSALAVDGGAAPGIY